MRGVSHTERARARSLIALIAAAALATAALTSPAPAFAAATSAAACPDSDLTPASDNLSRVKAAMLCLLNVERRQAGLVALRADPRLGSSAQYHSVEMVRYHFLAHQGDGRPSLLDRIQASGYFEGVRDGLYAENIGVGPGANGTAQALVDAWMESSAHRVNILLADWREIGIGAVISPPDPAFYADFPSTVYTTDFGRRYFSQRSFRRTCSRPARRSARKRATRRRIYCHTSRR
jgi:uncharacterized protein YkwD